MRLAVAYGAVNTTVLCCDGDGVWSPLRVDADPVLSSAVVVGHDGGVIAGQRAWSQPPSTGAFVAAPLRLGRHQATVGAVEIAVEDLVTATLALITRQATTHGATIGEVRLAVPAGWGPRHRMWIRHAANQAGLGQPVLVEAPVAAARHLVAAGGIRGLVGDLILVVDLGGGCEATVLRRTVDGYEVLSTMSDPDAGGLAVDGLLLAEVASAAQPQLTPSTAPVAVADRLDGTVILAAVRAAKEALATASAVTVAAPPPGSPVVLTRPVLDVAARPVWERAAQLAADAVTAADLTPDQLADVVCVGGSATSTTAVAAVAAALGREPVVPDDPGTAIVHGAADATITPSQAAPVNDWASAKPYVRKAAAMFGAGGLSLTVLCVAFAGVDLREPWWEPFRGNLYPGSYTYFNWGMVAVAAALAVVAALGGGVVLAGFLAEEKGRRLDGPSLGHGVLAATVFGVVVAALYGVTAAFYIGQRGVSSGLRWALLPQLPTIAVAAALAIAAVRGGRVPTQGWQQLLRFPVASTVLVTVGLAMSEFSGVRATGPLAVLLSLMDIAGGLLVGVAVACAVLRRFLFRAIAAIPLGLFCAILPPGTGGVLGVMYALAISVWLGSRTWDLYRSPLRDNRRAP
ncbi:Hsp70 protein [Asanoa ishikariensis]|uniref:Hsp70 protein n=1 Tax=Asanoa ishikariensis TaxID=137265 RepID=A0A1H3USX9_9ACTN|nr:Hsp70 protein [Asanoa ishikariensis]